MDPDEVSSTDQRRDRDSGDPVREGLEHLQAAARELVAAARSAIDACEGIVEDSDALRAAASTVSELFRTAAQSSGLTEQPHAADDCDPREANRGRVERIPLDPE